MGYLVRVLRTKNGKKDSITKSELEKLASASIRFHLVPSNSDNIVLVTKQDGKEISWLSLQGGELLTKNPSDDELQVMLDIAERLNARVRGDEFETYRTIRETYNHLDDKFEHAQAKAIDKQYLKRFKLKRIIYFVVLFATCLVVSYFLSRFHK